VFCAIRPEDVVLGGNGENSLPCKIDIIEYQGQSNSASASLANGRRVDFKSALPIEINSDATIRLPAEKMQIFTKGGE
jgi:hypothetical protein